MPSATPFRPLSSSLLLASLLTSFLLVGALSKDSVAKDSVEGESSAKIKFNQQIRPILSKNCISCHGPDEGDRQAGLRLDTFEGATEDFGGYSAVAPGDPEQSEIIVRILSDDPDSRMPPPEHGSPLKPDEVALLKQWIQEGGTYQTHWSFSPLQEPAVPVVPQGNVNNSIDPFILTRVMDAGLHPNSKASPRALVRRLSLDLTGLPPLSHSDSVRQAIDSYLQSPGQDQWKVLVDQLLETPAYAEHWTSMWLDIARYADTVGYSGDERREVWPWRDWLIRAIAKNQSYQDMTTELLAGDMLPNATTDQRLATAFHRNTLVNNEGGTNDEEFRTIAIKDRLSTTLNAWMGLTVRCAECHSHKYDPISQTEYYQLLDFFNQTVDSDRKDERPKLAIHAAPDPEVTAKLNAEISVLEKQLDSQPRVWKVSRPIKMSSREGTQFQWLEDQSILATGPNPNYEEYAFTFALPAGETVRSIRLETLPHVKNDGNVGRSFEGAFNLTQVRVVHHDGETDRPIFFSDAENSFNQVNNHIKTAIRKKLKKGQMKQGWAINHPVSGYKGHHEAVLQLPEPLTSSSDSTFTFYVLHEAPWPRLNIGCLRISTSDVADSAKKYRGKTLDPIRRKISKLIAQRDAPVRVPVMEELTENRRRKTHVNIRGNFQSLGDQVSAKFPDAFPSHDDSLPANRLGMAKWLFAPENPLTARVAVNRYWSRIMGIGLVETEEDFGTQGTPPSHPELLDHLAVEFRDGGWDVKALLRKLVLSATYQQGAQVTKQSIEIDPKNRLLSRGPRVRLTAEVVRDQALAVAGLLSAKRFGPPVYPPSPIKKFVNAFTGGMTWKESSGEDRYRRAIYTFLKRSSPHPLFETFDMSSRDVCMMRRLRTNTPLQSFMTLNDITFIEAARALGDQMQAAPKVGDLGEIESKIAFGYETALFHPPNEKQLDVLSRLYQRSLTKYQDDLTAALELTGVEDDDSDKNPRSDEEQNQIIQHAAMTVVSNVILNLDDFLNN